MKKIKKFKYTINFIIFLGILWTVIISAAAYINLREIKKSTFELALSEAKATVNKDLSFRLWVTSHGGVYVYPDKDTPPNPYLNYIPDRNIVTTKGDVLTLMNPAYVIRQVMDVYSRLYNIRGHITSLNPIRPENAADPWEKKSMESFEKGVKEVAEISLIDDKPYLRYMQPLITQEGCLKCHAHQGYKKGDIRGGLSTAVPLDNYIKIETASLQKSILTYFILWLAGITGIVVAGRRLDRSLEARKKREEDFENIFNLTNDLVSIASLTHFIRVNPSFTRILGYSEEELLGRPFIEFIHPDDIRPTRDIVEDKLSKGISAINFRNRYRHKNGSYRWLEWMTNSMSSKEHLYATARDITGRIEAEEQGLLNRERMESLIKISQHRAESLQELLDYALEEAIRLTRSTIGFIYYYSEEKREFTLNTWSRDVMKECSVRDPLTVYALDATGIWGEAVRQRRAILINDYHTPDPLKKGYPEGHVKLGRLLIIPVFNRDRIVLVVGVANKQGDYDTSDMNQLTLLMDTVWKLAEKKRAEDEILRSLNEKNILLREVHHRVKNNMAVIMSLLELQSGYARDDDSKVMFMESCNRIKSMALVHEKLYRSKNFAYIDISEYISELASELLSEYEGEKGNVSLKLDIENYNISLDYLIPLGLIINEILANTFKHAFVRLDALPEIKIALQTEEGMQVRLMISDNGIGLPGDDILSQKKTLGMQIIRALVHQLGGTMNIERNGGTMFIISFPLKKDA